jgi:hypothetical protein
MLLQHLLPPCEDGNELNFKRHLAPTTAHVGPLVNAGSSGTNLKGGVVLFPPHCTPSGSVVRKVSSACEITYLLHCVRTLRSCGAGGGGGCWCFESTRTLFARFVISLAKGLIAAP